MIKTLKITAVAAVVGLFATTSQAGNITVNWGATTAGLVLADLSTLAPADTQIQIGVFTGPLALGVFDLSSFVPFATGHVTDGFGAGFDGFFSIPSTDDEAGFATQQIYLVAQNTTLNQGGIYTSPNWKFPQSVDIPNSTDIDLGDVEEAGVIFGQGPVVGGPVNKLIAMKVIPEPTTGVLVGLSLLGVVGLRKRK